MGSNCYIIENTVLHVSVKGFGDELGKPMQVRVVSAAVFYDSVHSDKFYVLVLRNALHIPSMQINLIPLMMMRLAGVVVDECPKFLSGMS